MNKLETLLQVLNIEGKTIGLNMNFQETKVMTNKEKAAFNIGGTKCNTLRRTFI